MNKNKNKGYGSEDMSNPNVNNPNIKSKNPHPSSHNGGNNGGMGIHKEDFTGAWGQLKGKVKEKWGQFTDNEITEINGKYDLLIGKLQTKYGYTKEQAEREVNQLMSQQTSLRK